MQPTLLMIHKVIYITVHVDDVFMVGDEGALKQFVDFLKMKKRWSIEEKGPFLMGERFSYLKRDFTLYRSWCDIRCDYKQYESLSKEMDLFKKAYRKTPLEQNHSKRDESEELQGAEITRYRSVVGRLMYLAGERPDAQFAIQNLARFMARPTKQAWNKAWHVCSYLQGTEGYGVRIAARARGQSVMNVKDADEVESKEHHLLEVVTDADYAGDRNDRRSTTSFQVFIDGNLMESRVRAQKAISLSSGESEFVAVVAGSSDGLLIKHLWEKVTEEKCEMKVRSDSSAARAMVQRQGIGRVRHLDASLLWVQQKEKEKVLSIGPIPTELNCADLGTKALTRKRMLGLLYMLKVVQFGGERVGEEEYKELEHREQMKKGMKRVMQSKDLRVGLLMMMATMDQAAGNKTEDEKNEEEGCQWIVFWCCALLGALGLMNWLRQHVLKRLIRWAWNYMVSTMAIVSQETENYMNGGSQKVNKETQANYQADLEAWTECQKENEDLKVKLFQLDTYIEELEQTVQEVREQRNMALAEAHLASSHGLSLMKQSLNYRICRTGRKIHFKNTCPHFQAAEHLEMCCFCLKIHE